MPDSDRTSMDIGFVHIEVQFFGACQKLCRKCLIDFDPVHVILQGQIPSLFQSILYGRYWSDSHYCRVATHDAVTCQSTKRGKVVFRDGFFGCNNNTSRPVVDTASVGSRDNPVLSIKDRRQSSQTFHGGIRSRVLVHVHGLSRASLFAGDFDGRNFGIKESLIVRCRPALLASQGMGIAFFSSDAVLLGKVLGRDSHWNFGVGIGQSIPQTVPKAQSRSQLDTPSGIVARSTQGCITHVLGSTTNDDIGFAQPDRLGTEHHAFKAASAQPVDGQGGGRESCSGFQAHVSRQICGIGSGLNNVAKDDRIHGFWVQLNRLECGFRGVRSEIGCRKGFEAAPKRTEWRSFGRH
mmetsp:Transcript_24470/g.53602  ORF Transcript_24470/g.53602 Transcript_24470/m.53602 type:complete len:351 (-) Transcript_24470:165-1217(-)